MNLKNKILVSLVIVLVSFLSIESSFTTVEASGKPIIRPR